MCSIIPDLNKKYRQEGISITLRDMRMGVKAVNTIEHLTWIACKVQIKFCHDSSDALFFTSLQGENVVIAHFQNIFSNRL